MSRCIFPGNDLMNRSYNALTDMIKTETCMLNVAAFIDLRDYKKENPANSPATPRKASASENNTGRS